MESNGGGIAGVGLVGIRILEMESRDGSREAGSGCRVFLGLKIGFEGGIVSGGIWMEFGFVV